ncbi:two-component response regulator-like APRR9 [Diospyros lotus]|uniref:two-component response regulator-like APRR9 n=1 Tax=Diospyros lotus TaxID=55363 RepID=UPI0022589C4B|nr:two-component response regulator-like APRR9 [Diospyros lotus]
MGEVVVLSGECEDAMELEEKQRSEAAPETEKNEEEEEERPASVVRWEKFLPRMVLRVLLVESDYATRQIIALLLRKCNYRVAAVSDGLKAWEILKEKPRNIDLILAEVDLPSISGFALLTLTMEHEICKNIPVIMMSKHDSVSMVYKCMLRGAADFLVKPVRKNELRNLWQHVWRRQASASGGHGPQDGSVAQQKVEATAENNAASNHSSGSMACIQRNRECIEKGTDAQSSCTKPDLEADKGCTENVQDLSQPEASVSDKKMQKHEECVVSSRNLLMYDCEDSELMVATCKDTETMAQLVDVATESERQHANIISEACDKKPENPAREAIDLIGAFDNYPKCIYIACDSHNGTKKVGSSSLLDLSLRRSHPSSSINQVSDERPTLNHSDASAFSRYIKKALQPLHSSANNEQKDHGTNSGKQLSNHTLNCNSDTHCLPPNSDKHMLSLASGHSGQANVAFPCPQQTVLPIPIPTGGIGSLSTAYDSPPIFCTPSDASPMQSPGSVRPQEPYFPSNLETRNSDQFQNSIDQHTNNYTNQTEHKQRHKLESSEDKPHFSSANDQSATSSFCNVTASHFNTIGCGGNGNFDQVPLVRAAAEAGNEEGFSIIDRNCHRSVQREAALTKFRLKRKDRCYEKKVRYESRKKLAEQRPRMKGQFVRQMHAEAVAVENESLCGNQ